MPIFLCDDYQLHYAERGAGVPVIWLNGLAGDHLYWMGQMRAFHKHYHCLALDNRDAGQSSYMAAPYGIADLADDVARLMVSLGLPSAHIVGLSLGGMIAQELALRHPDCVRGLVLLGTLARADDWFNATLDAYGLIRRQVADSGAFFEALLPWLVSHHFFAHPERVDWLRALLRHNPHPQRIDGFFRQFDAIRRHDAWERLPAIRCPVLVAVGEDDRIIPMRYSYELQERLPAAKLVILPGVGHAPPIENPRQLNQLIQEFLISVDQQRGK
ncbi:MAG: alpha/beta fold hydrolase [Gemmataceae bacterium]